MHVADLLSNAPLLERLFVGFSCSFKGFGQALAL